jgi:hypothetical protein
MTQSKYPIPRNNGDVSLGWRIVAVIAAVVLVASLAALVAGCSGPVQMTPAYANRVEAAAIYTAELNRRCQAGDAEACKLGLATSSRTLQLLADALNGVDSLAGDPNAVN